MEPVVARIKLLTRRMERHSEAIVRDGTERDELVRKLRAEGWSLGRIASETGLSKARVQQLAR